MDIEELEKKHCVPCEGGVDPLDEDAARPVSYTHLTLPTKRIV